MRVLWMSCLLLGIVTTLPAKRGNVSPRSFHGNPFAGSLFSSGIYDQPAAPAPTHMETSYVGYNPFVAGYEGAPPVAASDVPHEGLYPTMEYGAGYDGVPPVAAADVPYTGYPMEHGAGNEGVLPVAPSSVPYAGYPMQYGAGYEGVPPVAAADLRGDGYEAASDVPYTGYPMEHGAGYEGALPVAASGVPYAGYPMAGLYPTMEYGAAAARPVAAADVRRDGYEAARPVVHYGGDPVPSHDAVPVYNEVIQLPDSEMETVFAYPDSLYPVSPYSDGYEAPVATTQPDGQEASVAPDGQHWGSVGGEADEPVFSDVSDLEPVSSTRSRSRYQRGRTVFYEATYIPEEGPAVLVATSYSPEAGPAPETSYTPEAAPVPETSYTPWMGYPTGPQKRPVMNPLKQRYPPSSQVKSNAVKRRY